MRVATSAVEWIGTILSLYLLIGLALFLFQKWLIFPSYVVSKSVDIDLKNILPIELKRDDGVVLEGFKIDNGAKKLLIGFGGNAQHASSLAEVLGDVAPSYDVIVFNYRGYGRSSGSPSAKRLLGDALEIYDSYEEGYDEVSTLGFSLGSSFALYLSSQREIKNSIIVGAYDSLYSIAKKRFFIYPLSIMLRENLDNISYAKEVENPISVVMVEGDIQVANIHTKNLLPHIKNLKDFITIDGTTHNSVLNHERLLKFVAQTLEE